MHSWIVNHGEASGVLDLTALTAGAQNLAHAATTLVERVRLCAASPYSSSALPRPRRSRSTATTAIAATATATTT